MSFLVDSHCHLASLTLEGKGPKTIAEVLARARACGVSHMLSVACTIEDYSKMMALIKPFDGIFNACGIHPLNLEEAGAWTEDELKACLTDEKCIALVLIFSATLLIAKIMSLARV